MTFLWKVATPHFLLTANSCFIGSIRLYISTTLNGVFLSPGNIYQRFSIQKKFFSTTIHKVFKVELPFPISRNRKISKETLTRKPQLKRKKGTKRRYSEEEDRLILSYVTQYGYNCETFKKLNLELNRSVWWLVQDRYNLITSNVHVSTIKKDWSLLEDEILMTFILKVRNNKPIATRIYKGLSYFSFLSPLDYLIIMYSFYFRANLSRKKTLINFVL